MSRFNPKHKTKVSNDSSDDDKDNETFVVYGTDFPEPVKGKLDEGQFQPVWKQEVSIHVFCRKAMQSFTPSDFGPLITC